MIDWNDNAKAAVEYFADWLRADYSYIANLEEFYSRLPQTKTVADAVEYYKGEFPKGQAILGVAYSNNKITPYYKGSPIADGTNLPESYIICTRDEFEAYVKEQDGEKWTHEDGGSKCRVIASYRNMSWIEWKSGELYVVRNDCLKPIKPTISTKEYDMLAKYAASLNVDPSEFEQYMSDNYESQLKD